VVRTGNFSTARRARALPLSTRSVCVLRWCFIVSRAVEHRVCSRCKCKCIMQSLYCIRVDVADLDDCDEDSHCFSIVPESLDAKKALSYRTDPDSGRTTIDEPFTDRMCAARSHLLALLLPPALRSANTTALFAPEQVAQPSALDARGRNRGWRRPP